MRVTPLVDVPGSVLFAAYVLAFGTAAVVCFAGLARTRLIEGRDTRRGLSALLLTSGGWAAAHVAFLLAPTTELKLVSYHIGLVVGISTVGPWLYFCSAYTGRTFHRSPELRRIAVGVFLAIVAVKLTNPLHGFYFRAEFVAAPFPHLAVHNRLLHWLAMGLAYALAAVGYFMLIELFWQIDHDTGPLVALVGVTGLPVVLDVLARTTPWLIEINYEPLGVAVFGVGVLFVFLEEFNSVRLASEHDDPVIITDDDDRVRDYNGKAKELFPALEVGEVLTAVGPGISESLESDESVIEIDRVGGMRYYQLSVNPFTTDRTGLGRTITLTDISEREQYRRELERQNERLEQFASMVSHDLRNPLDVAMGRIEIAREDHDSEHLDAAETALGRMESLIDDLLALARQGQPIDETERVTLSAVAEQCWEVVDASGAALTVETDLTFAADADRLQQLLENLFRNAIEHGSTSDRTGSEEAVRDKGAGVTIRVGALPDGEGFYVEDDGPGIPEDERDEVLESGYTTAEGGTGFGLAIIEEIVDAHGWEISVTEGDDGGARFEIRGVEGESETGAEDGSGSDAG